MPTFKIPTLGLLVGLLMLTVGGTSMANDLYDTIDAGLANSYLWSNGETTREIVAFLGGNYGVTIEAANGCYYHDSTELFWASPDVYGVVETSTGTPMQNQRILLVQHDTLNQALWAVDSTWTAARWWRASAPA